MSKYLSIIIPVYNTSAYLKECLDSVFEKNEDESDFYDVIIVDDGSTDNSEQIYNQYKNKANVFIVKQINSGVSTARNNGIKKSNSKYIMFLDSDDKLSKNWLEKIKKCMKKDYDVAVFAGSYNKNDYSKSEVLEACLGLNNKISNCYLNTIWSKVYKRELLINNNIEFAKDIINGEDTLFNFEVMKIANSLKIFDTNIYVFRKNLSSSTNVFNEKIVYSDIAFHIKLKDLIKDCTNYKRLKEVYDLTIFNGIKICLQRISSSKKADIKIITKLIENEEYKEILKNTDISSINTDKLSKYIFKLIKQKKYQQIIIICKIRNLIKKLYYSFHIKKEIMQEI